MKNPNIKLEINIFGACVNCHEAFRVEADKVVFHGGPGVIYRKACERCGTLNFVEEKKPTSGNISPTFGITDPRSKGFKLDANTQ